VVSNEATESMTKIRPIKVWVVSWESIPPHKMLLANRWIVERSTWGSRWLMRLSREYHTTHVIPAIIP